MTNGSARTTLESFSARQRSIMLLSLAHIQLNIISLIIDRGHIQYIKFTAGYYHLDLTPRRKYYLHLDMNDILPELIQQGAIFPIMGLLLCWLLISAFQK